MFVVSRMLYWQYKLMSDQQTKEIGKRVRKLRKEAGLTQVDLGKKSGLPANTIARLERGEHSPTLPKLEALARALGVKTSELLDA